MTDDAKKRKLEAALSAARTTVALLEAELDDVTTGIIGDDPLLDTKQIKEETGLGHDGVKAAISRGELKASRGPRQKILVARSELRRFMQATPVQPRKAKPAADLGDWDAQADAALRKIGGRK